MRINLLASLLLTGIIWTGVSDAQLGPKDGANLSATDLDRVKVGQPAPDFTLTNMDGKRISLSDFRGKKSVVLVFYRGHW
ncbi:MAG: redoxin domain-containing protein [Deltaproteobacteria bacterium]|nr:redoxin domain-containing protein [Deltaproteobacteria bacterium]